MEVAAVNGTRRALGHSSQESLATHHSPLVLDDSPMEDVQSQTSVDTEEEVEREERRHGGARTIYHQVRGDDDTVNSTRSLYDTDVVYSIIHNRRFCGSYYMPNDEEEQTRLQMVHEVFLHLFNRRLTTIPLNSPTRILDIGTGTGEWAMDMGEEYPFADIIGTDIAKIQPSAVPLNVFFEIDDAEEEGGWTWGDDEFDLIHSRLMSGAFEDWGIIYREAFRCLSPGGWIEIIDYDDHKDLFGYFGEDSSIKKWYEAIAEAAQKSGRPKDTAHLEPHVLQDLGFVDVRVEEYAIPMGVWPSDLEEQKVGKHFLVAQLSGVEAHCLRPFTEQLNWPIEEVRNACNRAVETVKQVALDPTRGQGLALKIKVLVGRKPGGSPLQTGHLIVPGSTDENDVDIDDGRSVSTMRNLNGDARSFT